MELDMTKGSPLKLIIRFMVPLIIGNIFQQLYNMAKLGLPSITIAFKSTGITTIERSQHAVLLR